MSPNQTFKSYIKTTASFLVLVFLALAFALFSLYWLPAVVGPFLAALSLLVALGGTGFACASAVVLARFKRGTRGKPDLFLELNRSREAAAIDAAMAPRTTHARRWLARRLLGHDLVVGDLVEVKTWAEIQATLDDEGCLDQLPFMPEMLSMCGRRARVFRCIHRLFDYRKTRRMRHMSGTVLLVGTVCDGSSHGNCEAACHTVWKSSWLRRVEPGNDTAGARASSAPSEPLKNADPPQFGTHAPHYTCQLTRLHAASQPIGKSERVGVNTGWSATKFLLPLLSGNVAPAAFVVGWLTHIFNEFQSLRQGVTFPVFETPVQDQPSEEMHLKPGDQVIVKSSAEIRATLNDQFMHRGLWFEPDMLKHCGRRCCVQAEVKKVIDIVTGEMLTMKTPSYILQNVHFSGERQLFNAQHEPLFWHAAWFRRDKD